MNIITAKTVRSSNLLLVRGSQRILMSKLVHYKSDIFPSNLLTSALQNSKPSQPIT